MSNGIRSLNGGGVDPSRPDTLVDEERKRMMDFFHKHRADTTKISQEGMSNFFQSDKYGDLLELVSQLRETHPEGKGTFFRPAWTGFPTVETYGKGTTRGGEYNAYDDKIRLNLLNLMGGEHGRGTNLWKVQEAWERTPAEDLESVFYHELAHSATPHFSDSETKADIFASVLEALKNASPNDPKEDVLNAARKIYWERGGKYTVERAMEHDAVTGRGTYRDPFVIDPDFKNSMRATINREMENPLRRILATEQYANHPLNYYTGDPREIPEKFWPQTPGVLESFGGTVDALMDLRRELTRRVIDRTKQGIGSLFGGGT